MRGHCKYSDDGFHQPTVTGDLYSMTYYQCLICGEISERGKGIFYGEERPVKRSIEDRVADLERRNK